MVRTLETIIEADVIEDCWALNVEKDVVTSICEVLDSSFRSLGKATDHVCVGACPDEKVLELSEPECELDPFCADVLVGEVEAADAAFSVKQVQPKKRSKKRSLIDKASKFHLNESSSQYYDARQQIDPACIGASDHTCYRNENPNQYYDPIQQMDPVYIRASDLAADWSSYIVNSSTAIPAMSMKMENALPTADQRQTAQITQNLAVSLASTNSKRNRKKSLIDKAAAQQRKEALLAHIAEDAQSRSQTFCSLCEGRRNSCGLCASPSFNTATDFSTP